MDAADDLDVGADDSKVGAQGGGDVGVGAALEQESQDVAAAGGHEVEAALGAVLAGDGFGVGVGGVGLAGLALGDGLWPIGWALDFFAE